MMGSSPAVRFRSWLPALAGAILVSLPLVSFAAPNHFTVIRNLYYGSDKNTDQAPQTLDLYRPLKHKQNPVIIYVHGGGWAFGDKSDVHGKPAFFTAHDIAFISMNYRLRLQYKLFDQLEDVVSVVHWVRVNHAKYDLDPDKIVLMGYGAGAFLVSLVGTDEDLLKTQGLSLKNLRSVVAVDNPSFDIPDLMKSSGDFKEKRRYRLIFGNDENVWSAMSPIEHIASGKGIPPFAIMYVTDNQPATDQAKTFAKALRDANVDVIMIPDNKKSSETVDEELGTPGDGPTLALMTFIGAAL